MFLSLMTAVKYQEDLVHNNVFYAMVSGIRKEELLLLEIEYLELIEYDLFIDSFMFQNLIVNLLGLFNIKNLLYIY